MPELSRFRGIIVKMLYRDYGKHNKPHIHAYYGEYEASVSIDGELLAGSFPSRQFKILSGWLCLKQTVSYTPATQPKRCESARSAGSATPASSLRSTQARIAF